MPPKKPTSVIQMEHRGGKKYTGKSERVKQMEENKKEPTRVLTTRLPLKMVEIIDQEAQATGQSRSEVFRKYLILGLAEIKKNGI